MVVVRSDAEACDHLGMDEPEKLSDIVARAA
jgi:hypothetical protein